jgi:DNA-binding CsgD family transcriptional regulator
MIALRERAERDPDASRDVLAQAAFSAGLSVIPAEVTARFAERALDAGRRPLPEPTDGPWFAQVTVALLFAERYRELDALLEAAIAEARATGDGALFSGAVAHRAWLALRRGDLAAAEGDTRTTLEAGLPLLTFYRLLALSAMVDALRERGAFGEADRLFEEAGTEIEWRTVTANVLRAARGRLRLAQGRPQEALADALAAGEVAVAARSMSPSTVPWRSDAALAHLALGDRAAAERLAESELADARVVGAPRAIGLALRTLGVVRDSEELLREALAVLETGEARLIHTRALTDLGGVVRRAGRTDEAREILRTALDTAHRLGAARLADRAESELRASGAKPRRAQLTGLAALTASERRVAELAGQGMTNREIAQALFVTARTVEGHLTQVFRKLDVPSREGLIDVS